MRRSRRSNDGNGPPDALKPVNIHEIIAVAQAAEPMLEVLVTGVLGKMGA